MLIILEGPDGSGKSTLSDQLRDELRSRDPLTKITQLKRSAPTRHPLLEYQEPLLNYRPGGQHIICDRWYVGETVYPQIYGRYTQWNIAVQRHMELFVKSRGGIIVNVLTDFETMVENVRSRGDVSELKTLPTIHPARDGFMRYFNDVPAFSMLAFPSTYDYRNANCTPSRVIAYAEACSDAAVKLRPYTTYVGPANPAFLLVGDVRGTDGPSSSVRLSRAPAFQPYNGTSGHFLLSHWDMYTGRYGLVNANDVDDVAKLIELLHEPLVVALGKRASARLDQLGVMHGTVPHPQFVRRFHHEHGEQYAEIIKRALYDQEDLSTWRP